MVTAPPEKELVNIFILNLLPKYKNHFKYLGLESFEQVYHIGMEIEDGLIIEADKGRKLSNGNKKE